VNTAFHKAVPVLQLLNGNTCLTSLFQQEQYSIESECGGIPWVGYSLRMETVYMTGSGLFTCRLQRRSSFYDHFFGWGRWAL